MGKGIPLPAGRGTPLHRHHVHFVHNQSTVGSGAAHSNNERATQHDDKGPVLASWYRTWLCDIIELGSSQKLLSTLF